ncbi:MAG: hypothetical protein ACLTYW_05735 [Collinsella sp.]
MYGAYHHITVMGQPGAPTRPQSRTDTYDITGNLCENNDKFAIDRELPHIDMGDLLVIHDTGAHGYSMGYNYNGRLRSAEVLLRPDGRPTSSARRAPGRLLLPRSTCCRAAVSCWPSRAPKAPPSRPRRAPGVAANGTNASRSRKRRRRTWTSAISRAQSSPSSRRLKGRQRRL